MTHPTISHKAIEAALDSYNNPLAPYGWRNASGALQAQFRFDMTRALTAALAVDGLVPQGWQTIDSAPINRAILIKTNVSDYYGNSGIYEAMLVDMGSGQRWHIFGYAVGRDLGSSWIPTHWMPLPAAPTGTEG